MRLVVVILAIYSCSILACNKSNEIPPSKEPWTVNGTINIVGGETSDLAGYQISLVFEDIGADKRITATIDKEGNFTITPTEVYSPFANLYFEEDLVNERVYNSRIPLILEEKGVYVQLPISVNNETASYADQTPKFMFEADSTSFDAAPLTNQYFLLFEQIVEELGPAAYNYGDPKKQAELVEKEFPAAKVRLMAFFEKLVSSNTNEWVLLNLLEANINLNDHPFSVEYLDDGQRKQLLGFLNNMSFSAKSTETFTRLFNLLNGKPTQIIFTDFSVTTLNQDTLLLSDIIKKQEFTALYFWWSGCGPCRIFNAEVDEEHLKTLEEKGIQLVSINFDRAKELWYKATTKDQISWQNLYSGEKSDLYYAYNVSYFPTKLVFNRNAELIEIAWNNLDELDVALTSLNTNN